MKNGTIQQVLNELETVPENFLPQVLEFIRCLKSPLPEVPDKSLSQFATQIASGDLKEAQNSLYPEYITPDDFWQEATIEELATEQGITIPQKLDSIIGAAANLWEDDKDLETFISEIYLDCCNSKDLQMPSRHAQPK